MIDFFDAGFRQIHANSLKLLDLIDADDLYRRPDSDETTLLPISAGELLLRSAAVVEQTAGGISRRLWDDPFEWTLPEKLFDKRLVRDYLDDVEAARLESFGFLTSESDLHRLIPAPEKLRPIGEILTETLIRAAHFQGRAFAAFQILSGKKPPRL